MLDPTIDLICKEEHFSCSSINSWDLGAQSCAAFPFFLVLDGENCSFSPLCSVLSGGCFSLWPGWPPGQHDQVAVPLFYNIGVLSKQGIALKGHPWISLGGLLSTLKPLETSREVWGLGGWTIHQSFISQCGFQWTKENRRVVWDGKNMGDCTHSGWRRCNGFIREQDRWRIPPWRGSLSPWL